VETGKIPDSIVAKAKVMAEETRLAEARVSSLVGQEKIAVESYI
jgi:hypothetical protein